MSTHGRILVKGGHAEDGDIHVYAWHDGHTTDALDMLLHLPCRIFNEGKESAISERKPGFWFYETMLRQLPLP